MHQLNDKYIVPLPSGAYNVVIAADRLIYNHTILAWSGGEPSHDEEDTDIVDLPPGSWQILCTSETVTEEVAAGMVDEHYRRTGWFADYEEPKSDNCWYETALSSLSSYLAANNINSPYVILGKI